MNSSRNDNYENKQGPDMTIRFSIIKTASLLVLVGLACTISLGSNDVVSDEQTDTDSGIFFSDAFSDRNSGWDRYSDSDAITDYENGIYRIYVSEAYWDYWANPGKNFTDVRVEVDATKAGGPDENDIGVICRYNGADDNYLANITNIGYYGLEGAVRDNIDDFYSFTITSDGYYGIGKTMGDDMVYIGQDELLPSDAINLGQDTNHIRADCIGSELSLFVNGKLLASVTDNESAVGDVGLMAGTYDTPGTDIHFDNFVVYDPAVKK
jgi:hypothetical protein